MYNQQLPQHYPQQHIIKQQNCPCGQIHQPVADRPIVANRSETDPNYYDGLFNSKTREEDRTNKTAGSRNVFDYNMFAPKFQNHTMPSTDQIQRPTGLAPTKRDQQIPFPTRRPQRQTFSHSMNTASHPMQNRTLSSGGESFNRTIDSMHVPEEMQRPVASRDYARSNLDNGRKDDNPQMGIIDRQFSMENFNTGLPLTGGGSFEDMFY